MKGYIFSGITHLGYPNSLKKGSFENTGYQHCAATVLIAFLFVSNAKTDVLYLRVCINAFTCAKCLYISRT